MARDLPVLLAWRVGRQAVRIFSSALDRARSVLERVADDDGVTEVLGALPHTLLRGDVPYREHPREPRQRGAGGLGERSHRIPDPRSGKRRRHGGPWVRRVLERLATRDGVGLDLAAVELGYRWAALEIPIQYLAWVVESRSPAEVDRTLDQAEDALGRLP